MDSVALSAGSHFSPAKSEKSNHTHIVVVLRVSDTVRKVS